MYIKFRIQTENPEVLNIMANEYAKIVNDLLNKAISDLEFPDVRTKDIETLLTASACGQARSDAYVAFISYKYTDEIPVVKNGYFAMYRGYKLFRKSLTFTLEGRIRQYVPVEIKSSFFEDMKQMKIGKLEIFEELGEWFGTINYKPIYNSIEKGTDKSKKPHKMKNIPLESDRIII